MDDLAFIGQNILWFFEGAARVALPLCLLYVARKIVNLG